MIKKAVLFLAILFYVSVGAQSLGQFPRAEAVAQMFKGKDATDSYLKQAAAIHHLQLALNVFDGKRSNALSPEERNLNDSYQLAYDDLIAKAAIPKPTGYAPDAKKKQLDYYEMSGQLQHEVLIACFDERTVARLKKSLAESLILGNDNEMTPGEAKEQANLEEEAMMKATGNRKEGLIGWVTSIKYMKTPEQVRIFWTALLFVLLLALIILQVRKRESIKGCLIPLVLAISAYFLMNSWTDWDWPFMSFVFACAVGGLPRFVSRNT